MKITVEIIAKTPIIAPYSDDGIIDEGEVETITIDCQNVVTLTTGKTYDVKIVCTDGTHLTFSVKAD